jgi:hypothetical protein
MLFVVVVHIPNLAGLAERMVVGVERRMLAVEEGHHSQVVGKEHRMEGFDHKAVVGEEHRSHVVGAVRHMELVRHKAVVEGELRKVAVEEGELRMVVGVAGGIDLVEGYHREPVRRMVEEEERHMVEEEVPGRMVGATGRHTVVDLGGDIAELGRIAEAVVRHTGRVEELHTEVVPEEDILEEAGLHIDLGEVDRTVEGVDRIAEHHHTEVDTPLRLS